MRTDRHTPMTTIPDGLRRAGNQSDKLVHLQKQNKNQRIKTFFTVEATTRLGLSVIVYSTLK